jgi:hypothetical protein
VLLPEPPLLELLPPLEPVLLPEPPLLELLPPLELVLLLEPPLLEPELPPSPAPSSVRPPHACVARPPQRTKPKKKPIRTAEGRMGAL